MNIRFLLIAAGFTLLVACQKNKKDSQQMAQTPDSKIQLDLPDSLSTKRVAFALGLKKAVAKRSWSEFGIKENEGTLIYFDADQSEVFFPNTLVKEKLEGCRTESSGYCTISRTDSIPYHMEVMISFDKADSLEYFFKNPVEQYSSVEEIGNYIPSVQSTEMWSTMVVHEMFHHFQYNDDTYVAYAESDIGTLPFDSRNLVALCQEDEQFMSLIQEENRILMKAISENNQAHRDTLILSYLKQREKRIESYRSEHPYLEQVENYYILQEGSARYMEYQSMLVLNSYVNNSDAPQIPEDPKFNSYEEFAEINLENDAYNYLVYAGPTDYHYTLGFNMMRLLDELKVEYKADLLKHPEKGLHQYLQDYMTTLHSEG